MTDCAVNMVCRFVNRDWGHSSSFVEAKMDERKQKSHREKLRDAIDQAIYEEGKETSLMKYFYQRLEQMGYLVDRRGKYLRVRPDEGKRFFRFDFLGAGYTERDIAKRMQAQFFGNREPDRSYRYQKREKAKGIYGLYLHYQYLLGVFPKARVNDAEIYVAMREDLKKIERYSEEAQLLGNNHIVTAADLNQFFYQTRDCYNELKVDRQKLRNKLRRMHDSEAMLPIKAQVAALSDEIGKVGHKLSLIRDIGQRSGIIEYICDTVEYEHECRENRYYAERHAPPPLPERNVQWLRQRAEHQEIRRAFEREQQQPMYSYRTMRREDRETR